MRMQVFALVLASMATAATAQEPVTNDLTPTLKPQRYRICNDRPDRPAWADELPIREAWKGLTLRGIYELRAWENILESEDCSCEVRFPEWEEADREYTERFAHLTQPEHTQAQRDLRRQSNDLRHAVQAICEAQGNW